MGRCRTARAHETQSHEVARMSKLTIEWKPSGFAECLQGTAGELQAAAESIASRASSYLEKGSGFHVEMDNEARYQDSSYGVSRPVAYVVPDDDESAAEEAENKILSKAVM